MKIQGKSMPSPGKGGKEKFGEGKKGGKKGKESHSSKSKRQQNTHDSMENVETVESIYTNQLIVGSSRRTNLKVKARGGGKSKSQATEISESDRSKQVDETWTSNTSAQQPNLSQVIRDWMRR